MNTFVIWRGPLRWRRLYYGDETAIPHAYSNHSPASVCELNGWSFVRECHGDVAIVRDEKGPWVEITPATMPPKGTTVHLGNAEQVAEGTWTVSHVQPVDVPRGEEVCYFSESGFKLAWTPTHWAPIVRPAPPGATP